MTSAPPPSSSGIADAPRRHPSSPVTRRMRRLARTGWVPDQHGAWPMAFLPLLIGTLDSGPALIHLPIAIGWLAAFALFCIVEAWVKAPARRRSSLTSAGLAWGSVAAACGLALLLMAPAIVAWLPLIAPFWAMALWEVSRGGERALSARFSSIFASSLLVPVASWAGRRSWTDSSCSADSMLSAEWLGSWASCLHLSTSPALVIIAPAAADPMAHAWTAWFFAAAYFIGTVPVVRSLIRGRDDPRWAAGSVVWHALILVVAVVSCRAAAVRPIVPIVWVALAGRALVLPIVQRRRGRPLAPIVIGMSEMCWSTLVVVSLVVTAA